MFRKSPAERIQEALQNPKYATQSRENELLGLFNDFSALKAMAENVEPSAENIRVNSEAIKKILGIDINHATLNLAMALITLRLLKSKHEETRIGILPQALKVLYAHKFFWCDNELTVYMNQILSAVLSIPELENRQLQDILLSTYFPSLNQTTLQQLFLRLQASGITKITIPHKSGIGEVNDNKFNEFLTQLLTHRINELALDLPNSKHGLFLSICNNLPKTKLKNLIIVNLSEFISFNYSDNEIRVNALITALSQINTFEALTLKSIQRENLKNELNVLNQLLERTSLTKLVINRTDCPLEILKLLENDKKLKEIDLIVIDINVNFESLNLYSNYSLTSINVRGIVNEPINIPLTNLLTARNRTLQNADKLIQRHEIALESMLNANIENQNNTAVIKELNDQNQLAIQQIDDIIKKLYELKSLQQENEKLRILKEIANLQKPGSNVGNKTQATIDLVPNITKDIAILTAKKATLLKLEQEISHQYQIGKAAFDTKDYEGATRAWLSLTPDQPEFIDARMQLFQLKYSSELDNSGDKSLAFISALPICYFNHQLITLDVSQQRIFDSYLLGALGLNKGAKKQEIHPDSSLEEMQKSSLLKPEVRQQYLKMLLLNDIKKHFEDEFQPKHYTLSAHGIFTEDKDLQPDSAVAIHNILKTLPEAKDSKDLDNLMHALSQHTDRLTEEQKNLFMLLKPEIPEAKQEVKPKI